MYEASYSDYTSGRYDLAIQGFEGFIQAFPRLPNAADAQFNIGMSVLEPGQVDRGAGRVPEDGH